MNKIKKSILNILKLLIPDDLLSFLWLFFVVIPMIIYSSVYIYNGYLDFNYAKQNIMKYYKKNNAYPTDISQLNKENLVNINGNFVDDFYESEVFNLWTK